MSTEFRPLSTQALSALELHDLNPVDTSWSAFNYYLYPSWQGYISYVLLDSSCLLCVFLRCRHLYSQVEVVVVGVCVYCLKGSVSR